MSTRSTYTLVAAVSVVTGWAAFYGVDKIRFLWGHTVRDHRYAGWLDKYERKAAA